MTTNFKIPLDYSDQAEVIPADEDEDIRHVVQAVSTILQRSLEKTGRYQSDVHVKTVGNAIGEFRVLPNLPSELAQGLFHIDHTYPAVVHFSNSASQQQPDWLPDGRGMSIKLLGVDGDRLPGDAAAGKTQDFVMINHPVFFARNVKEFRRLEQVLVDANDQPLATLQGMLTGGDWNPLHWHWSEAITALRIAGHIPAHPASYTYFSMAPIRFGKYIAKYRVQPTGDRPDSWLDLVTKLGTDADGLHLMLAETLRTQQVLFEFQVQLRTSDETMPIEDATVEWPESESPYRTVALFLIPRQDIAPLQNNDRFKHLAFNVWHALADHRPLGGINRLRREAYRISSSWRRQAAEIAPREPESINDLQ
jgi:catalase